MQTASHRLIGPASATLKILRVKSARLAAGQQALKTLLHGPKGTGKSEVAKIIACELAGAECNIELRNGKEISVDFVRDWKRRCCSVRSLFGGCFVLIADECDKMTADARDLLLSVLDELPAHCAFIGTTNHDLATDSSLEAQRFLSRLHCLEVPAPISTEICTLLVEIMPELPPNVANMIAELCGGCVRSAIIDAENFLDTQIALAA